MKVSSVVVTAPRPDAVAECPTCGFDAVVEFSVSLLGDEGVSNLAYVLRCVRCWQEAQG